MNPKTAESARQYRDQHLRQYRHFKGKYPEYVLLFRIGDFYETYGEDAQICHRLLGLTLTTRSTSEGELALAGVPQEYIYGYLRKLIQAGKHVALVEQIADKEHSLTVLVTSDREDGGAGGQSTGA